ncbi:MAG: nucleotidyltransferase family protein [Candidatus Zipacnadales bacterium]
MTDSFSPRVMILAAGKGTRLYEAGIAPLGLPKPLIPLAGKPVLEHNLELCRQHGITEVAINLHYLPEAIREFVGTGARWNLDVRYSEEPVLLGTAGAVKRLAAFFAEADFLVLYGDNYTDVDLRALLRQHLARGAWATIAVFDSRSGRHSGIAGSRVGVTADDRITAFEETRGAIGELRSPWINAGVYALNPRVLEVIPSDIEWDFGRDVFPVLLQEPGALWAYRHPGFCFALDTPEAYYTAQERILKA